MAVCLNSPVLSDHPQIPRVCLLGNPYSAVSAGSHSTVVFARPISAAISSSVCRPRATGHRAKPLPATEKPGKVNRAGNSRALCLLTPNRPPPSTNGLASCWVTRQSSLSVNPLLPLILRLRFLHSLPLDVFRRVYVDGNPSYPTAISELKQTRELGRTAYADLSVTSTTSSSRTTGRSNGGSRASQGFRALHPAGRRLEGIKTMNMIRKGQIRWLPKNDIAGQAAFIERLFGLVSA